MARKSQKSKSSKKSKSKSKSKKAKKGLIIVESPAKAKTLERYSDGKFMVKASMGHVRDLPKTSLGVDLENQYTPKYITIRGKKQVLDELKKGVKEATEVFLASDPDREGEAIAWHLANLLKIKNPLRIELHEITKQAFKDAIKKPREINMNLVNAQQARRILDRLVGYKLSPLLWRKISDGLSAGRVQSVAVKLICDRQREIDKFVPEEYWTLDVLASKEGEPKEKAFVATLVKEKNKKIKIPNKETSDKIIEKIKQGEFFVSQIKKKDQKKNSPPPFKTSTLQQEASRKLGFPARKTMMIAQQLYEGVNLGEEGMSGLITYMRTDSLRISPVAEKEASEFIAQTYGSEYVGEKRKFKKGVHAQEAHEAIRPTSVYRTPNNIKKYLSKDQFRLYKLIWERFVASQMAPAIMEITTVDILNGDYLFRASDSKVKFKGYTILYDVEEEESKKNNKKKKKPLPVLKEGEKLQIHEYIPQQHFTQPPPPYTEGTLIKELEERGIGRPSTFAPIVSTIQKRGYVELKDKKFYPTKLGFMVTDLLEKYFGDIINVDFTADMESKLDLIEEGKIDWIKVVDNFFKPFSKTLEVAHKTIPKLEIEPEPAGINCDVCGRPMVIKQGRFGKFIACSGYPECTNTKPYLKEIGVPCPVEGCDGQIVEKKSRKGKFYGCSNYPKCTFASWDKPINERCPRCGKIMVLKFSRGGKPYKSCIDPNCK